MKITMNKLTSIILALGLGLFFYACGDKEILEEEIEEEMEVFPDYSDLQIVTGLFLYDASGIAIGKVGNPNHKHGEGLFVYPIPATTSMRIQTTNSTISKVFLIDASCYMDSSGLDLIIASDTLQYTSTQLESKSVLSLDLSDDTIALNLSNLEKGFYRLFILLNDDEYYWYNTYIDPSLNNIPDFAFYDEGCL